MDDNNGDKSHSLSIPKQPVGPVKIESMTNNKLISEQTLLFQLLISFHLLTNKQIPLPSLNELRVQRAKLAQPGLIRYELP